MISGTFKTLARPQIITRPFGVVGRGWNTPIASAVLQQQHQRCGMSSESTQRQAEEKLSRVYVHHVSKVVLEHLQDSRADWLMNQGLHRGLRIKNNGTFVLEFPARKGFDSGRIWYVRKA
jgi:hypothetical protein